MNSSLTPQDIVRELDKYVIGQPEAKKCIAIALRNRERRRQLIGDIKDEIIPKNIMMIGPTGVGKSALSSRLASLIQAPFLKVEATKFTEVGYVGKDVESIASDLVENSVMMVYQQKIKEVEGKAEKLATEKILSYLCREFSTRKGKKPAGKAQKFNIKYAASADSGKKQKGINSSLVKGNILGKGSPLRKFISELFDNHELDEHIIEIELENHAEEMEPFFDIEQDISHEREAWEDYLRDSGRGKAPIKKRKMAVKEARRLLVREESRKLLDFEEVIKEAVEKAEENGVVFIDEIDKLIGPRVEVGRDISGEGVQRDLLPLVEGTTVMTRYGPVKTSHILFIAAGTFYNGKPSDLIPEIQGRFPLRVEMHSLQEKDLARILTEPQNSLIKQYKALLDTEGVELTVTEDGVNEMARLASSINQQRENIGARRLFTILEKVLEDISFNAPSLKGQKVVIDSFYVQQHVAEMAKSEDLARYIM